jgi:Lectin C-type domain
MRSPEYTILVSLFVVLASSLPAQKWVKHPSSGHRYAITTRMSWTNAQAQARKWGGHLVTIGSRAEHDWVFAQFGKFVPGVEDGYWIGFSDAAKEGTWVWSNGAKPKFTNWLSNQPDNKFGVEHYAHVWGPTFGTQGKWNDIGNIPAVTRKGFPGVVELSKRGSFVEFGKGCASATPVPRLSSANVPEIGVPLALQISNVAPLTGGFLVFGGSDRKWNGLPLPLDLKSMGMPGCTMFVSWDVHIPIFSRNGGRFPVPFAIPLDGALVGRVFFAQAWLLDAKSNVPGVAVTNGVKGVISE